MTKLSRPYLQALSKEFKPHARHILRLQAWFRMLLVQARARPLWQDLQARKQVLRAMTDSVISVSMVPQIVTELLHFNQWNKSLPFHPPQHYQLVSITDATIHNFVHREARTVLMEALEDITEHLLRKRGHARPLDTDTPYERALLNALLQPLARQVAMQSVLEVRDDILLDLQLKPILRAMIEAQIKQTIQEAMDQSAVDLIFKDMLDEVLRVKPRKYGLQVLYDQDSEAFQPKTSSAIDDHLNRIILGQLIKLTIEQHL